MRRLHLIELEDQQWLPAFLRNYATDFLSFLSEKTGIFRPAIPIIEKGLENLTYPQIVDLGSGAGGPIPGISRELLKTRPDLKIILTDRFPNVNAWELIKTEFPAIDYFEEPIDARAVPKNLPGLRTLFLVLHHFKPTDAKNILQDAVTSGYPIAVFEGQERSFLSLLAMIFSPITVLFTTPFIKPFRFGRLLFTYLIPVVPLLVLWDGVVSSLRTYSISEMNELIKNVKNSDKFFWETGKLKSGPGEILYLLGIPRKK